jgi:hypothetical protein
MALQPVTLDDLTWADLTASTRGHIAAASDGRWTLHAPVDPGVTLLELFAWQLEQRLYWMDQVPDALVRALLRLLGEAPRPAQPAATVLALAGPDQQVPGSLDVPAGTALGLLPGRQIVFTTDEAVSLLPVANAATPRRGRSGRPRVELYVAGKDRSKDLEQGRAPCLLPAHGGEAEAKIVLWLTQRLGRQPRWPVALFFDLDVPGRLPPQWSADAPADAPPPARLTWWYSRETGEREPFRPERIVDGTGGLRRSGVVRLQPGEKEWQPDPDGPKQVGLVPYALWLRTEQATFTAPPRLTRLVPNAAIAHHRRTVRPDAKYLADQAKDWLPLPHREIVLREDQRPPLEETVRVRLRERGKRWRAWKPTADLTFHGPADRVFEVDRAAGKLRFGDGLTGRLPVLDRDADDKVQVEYAVGGGPAGNVGANLTWASEDDALTALNVVAAEGGADPEPLDEARRRVAGLLRRHTRAVTGPDYETLAQETPGVAVRRAHSAVGYHPAQPCTVVPGAVTVFVVPDAPRGKEECPDGAAVTKPEPDPGLLAAVRARLADARLVTAEVFVCGPRYRRVALAVDVATGAAEAAALRTAITERLRKFLDPLTGGDDGKGWPFGEPLRPTALLRVLRGMPEGAEVDAVYIGIDGAEATEKCLDVPLGPHDLVALEGVAVRLLRPAPGRGGLP